LHVQNTAALQLKASGQAILQKLTRKDVFVKQANIIILPNSSKEINIQLYKIINKFTNFTIINMQPKPKAKVTIKNKIK